MTGHPVRSAVRTVPWVGLGTAGLLGHGLLDANWGLGGTSGVTDPAR